MDAPPPIVNTLIGKISSLLWQVLAGLSVIMLIYAGILFIIASGDPNKVTEAKRAVICVIIGVLVGILAFSLPAMINTIAK